MRNCRLWSLALMVLTAGSVTAGGFADRKVVWQGVDNVRDFGGMMTTNGLAVRAGLVYRSQAFNDNAVSSRLSEDDGLIWSITNDMLRLEYGAENADELLRRMDTNDLVRSCERVCAKLLADREWWRPGKTRLTEESRRQILETTGMKTEIDLRYDSECWSMTGSPLGPSVNWVHIPSRMLGDINSATGRVAFARAFRLFLDEKNYPIVFHCIAGADRTGGLAFVLESLLGVTEEEMVHDYVLTSESSSGPRTEGRLRRMMRAFDPFPGGTIHERVHAYVRSCGFSDDDIDVFRRIMLGDRKRNFRPSAVSPCTEVAR